MMTVGELRRNGNTELRSGDPSEQVNAIAKLPNHLAVLRMENDNIMSLAAAHPRDQELMKAELEGQLRAFPKHAAKMVYAKPVGKESDICADCGKECWPDKKTKKPAIDCFSCGSRNIIRGAQKYARGLSVRAAEMLAEVYGYNRVRTAIEDISEDKVRVEATFVDFQKGRTWTDDAVVSKFFTRRDKSIERIPDDRFYGVVARAEASKRVREVITRCVSAGLKAWLYDECEKLIDQSLDENTVNKIIQNFANKGVRKEQLEQLIGRTIKDGWLLEDRKNLLGIWSGIESGEMTIQEVFCDLEEKKDVVEQSAPKPATPTENALTNPQLAKTQAKPSPAAQEQPPEQPPETPDSVPQQPAKPAQKKSDLAAAQAAAKAAISNRSTANAVAQSLQRNIGSCTDLGQIEYMDKECDMALEHGDIDLDTYEILKKQSAEKAIEIERSE